MESTALKLNEKLKRTSPLKLVQKPLIKQSRILINTLTPNFKYLNKKGELVALKNIVLL